LAPLVETAADKGEQAGIVSVFSAGHGGQVDLNDLGLVKGYSLSNAAGSASTYTDAAFQVRRYFIQLTSRLTFPHLELRREIPKNRILSHLSRNGQDTNGECLPWSTLPPSAIQLGDSVTCRMCTGTSLLQPLHPNDRFDEPFQVMWWRVWSSDSKWKTGAHEIDNRGNSLAPNKFVTLEGKKAIWEHAVKLTS
jgi:hypothetical protein